MNEFDKNNLSWKMISPFMDKIENGEVSKSWTTDHYGENKSFSDFRIPLSAIANVAQRQLLTFMVASRFRYTSLNSVYESERDIFKIANHQIRLKNLFDMIVFHKFIVRNPQMRLDYDAFVTEEWNYMADSYADLYNQFYPFWNTPKIFKCLINVSSQYDIKKYGAVNTPYDLVKEIDNRIPDKAFDENVLDPACGYGSFLYEAKQRMIKNGLSSDDAINNIYGVDIDLRKCYISSAILNPEGEKVSNIFWANALTGTNQENPTKQAWTEMKFKVVSGNFPYQDQQNINTTRGGGTTLWDKFVNNAIKKWLKEDGFLATPHPAGWRNYKGDYISTRETLLKNNRMIWLSIYSQEETKKLFGVDIRVDAYVVQKNTTGTTTIRCEDGTIIEKDLNDYKFIPNSNFELYEKYIAKDEEETADVMYSRSAYGSDKTWVSKAKTEVLYSPSAYESRKDWISQEQDEVFKYPVIHSLRKNDEHYILWSSRNDKGHFGIPKVIFGVGNTPVLVDKIGEYGLSQHTRGIVDDPENLDNIAKALESKRFLDFMQSFLLVAGKHPDIRNKDAIALLRKDFWRDFV